ncbi:recombinase family protein [Streptomyces sp. ME02-6991-2B]|nr:recombinase family protein [Streptomyces sp. ME02-6991-2B]
MKPRPHEPEPYIGYIRVSTWKEEKISPEIQRAAIDQWAARTGRRIVDWVEDLDATGRNFKRRIMQAIEAVEGGAAHGIAVWKYSRFGRNDLGIAVNLARLENVGGQLESATEEIDARTAVGRFNRAILFDLAVFESDRAGEQWKETHAHRLGLLLPSAGRPRFGYIWHPRRVPDATAPGGFRLQEERYEPHPEQAAALAECYLAYINGTGFIELARTLNGAGFTTTRGKVWRHDTLLRYMDSGFAAGLLQVRDGCKCPTDKKSSCRHWRRFRGAHDPVIHTGLDRDPEEMWEEYRERRASIAKTPPRARVATYDLTGLVRCVRCRGSMTGHINGGAVYWRCAKSDAGGDCTGVSATYSQLLDIVGDFLRDVADGIDQAPGGEIAAPQLPAGPDPAHERARLMAEHTRLQDALTRLTTDYALNPSRYPADAYDRAVSQLEADRNAVLAKLAPLEKEAQEKRERPALGDFRPMVVGVLPEWDTFTPLSRNLILRQLMRHVLVSPRPSRGVSAARVVPVWEAEETQWVGVPDIAPDGTAPAGPLATVGLEALPDGIAWSIA